MSAPARLLGLRLQGFKSFAEKTVVEFGPGISAVVGPNGSGKSNLADALRWALGEQGRQLRIRKSEDVIWAGSERRAAQGMADVTIVVDNGDGLLPVEYAEVELGRRLYRSGENDYLLNRQRVRLRDLVDLLDAAHLADNAFLFIGQGMVDQALALRPEERRPLFEEVAGVRRHERRRRRAEEQLAESEVNLARVEDILAELRPQARRLAAQAEQQASRATAGEDLADAIIASTHARWADAAQRARAAATRREQAVAAAERAMADLTAAESAVAAITVELDERAMRTRVRADAHERARSALETARLREARAISSLESIRRDRDRLIAEREAAAATVTEQRRALAAPVPERDVDAEAALGAAERSLAEALAELASLRAAERAESEQAEALRRAVAAAEAEREVARRRHADARRRADAEAAQQAASAERLHAVEAAAATAAEALEAAVIADEEAAAARDAARSASDATDAEERMAAETLSAVRTRRETAAARHRAASERLEEDETRPIARLARRHGGRRVDEGLLVDERLRRAVERVLGERARAYLVDRTTIPALVEARGHLVVSEAVRDNADTTGETNAAALGDGDGLANAAAALGGGMLADALRRDATGAAAALLAHAVWVPDLAAALELQPTLPVGWVAVSADGSALVTRETVELGQAEGILERRAEVDRLAAEVAAREAEVVAAEERASAARERAREARAALASATDAERRTREERRRAEDAARLAQRNVETAAREATWHAAQAERFAAEVARAEDALASHESASAESVSTSDDLGGGSRDDQRSALATWEARAAELRSQRDRLADVVATHEAERRSAEQVRARAEATIAWAERSTESSERQLVELGTRERSAAAEVAEATRDVEAVSATEAEERRGLAALRDEDEAASRRLRDAEAQAQASRERVRSADEAVRAADVADLEARLGLEAIREGALVELAGLGTVGLRRLEVAAAAVDGTDAFGHAATSDTSGAGADVAVAGERTGGENASDGIATAEPDVSKALELALARASTGWTSPPDADPPSVARLATLRRRYHELGAGNPFAVEEYEALKERLATLETQAADLRAAISQTRALIEELNGLIAGQFAATFRALEVAFDARFTQLFGGGFARLSLTEPDDLSATGIEIVARPPGKKAQALAMLSGGERALTAVALLFAMLEVRPVPFCVLDEVDAALDEANVGRFTEALRSLADRTQFVVITHNRGTIEAADALYGVTVGDDSVSRVISLRLEEATAMARPRQAALAGVG